jgi:hypothetical protein
MKSLIAICLCTLAIPLIAQTTVQTFTSPDGDFRFKYSSALIHCTQRPTKPGEDVGWIEEACASQGDLCDDDATSGATFVCLAYPNDKFKDKPAFVAAVFFVGLVPAATTQKSCLEGSQVWLVNDARPTRINGISARLVHTSDAWTSGGESGEIYRVFHGDRCYELGIQEVESSTGSYDPGTFEEYTAKDRAEVHAALQQPLDSFKFLK